MPDRWIVRRLVGRPAIRPGGEAFRVARPDRFGCLLIHGWAGSPAEMRPIGTALADRGIDVLGVRLAGHATSLWDHHQTSHRDWLASAEAALTGYLAEKDRVVLCGFSMGGVIALRLAAEHAADPRIAGVVTLATPFRFRRGPEARRSLLRRVWRRFREGRPYTRRPAAAQDLIYYRLVGPRSVASLYRLIADTEPLLPRIHQPILIVQSLSDPTVPAFNAELIAGRVGSREPRIVWLSESGHLVTVDYDADRVTAEVLQFVTHRRAGAAIPTGVRPTG